MPLTHSKSGNMKMKNVYQFIVIILGTSLIINTAKADVNVVATTQDIASISKFIGNDQVDVISLTKGSRDPHFATAKPSMIRKVFRADLVIAVGADLEIGWLPALLQSGRNPDVLPGTQGYLDLSKFINLKGRPKGRVTRDMGDVHAAGNPHYWLNPDNGVLMAKAIADKLSELDPGHTQLFQENAKHFQAEISERKKHWQSALDFLKGNAVISYHTSMLYLADAFGFKIVGNIEPKPGISPSASHLNKLINTINQQHIPLLIMEPYYEKRSAQLLERKTGIHIAIIPQSVNSLPGVDNYFKLFDKITEIIKGSF